MRITHSCSEVQPEAGKARAGLEAGEHELVDDDRGEPDQRDRERVVVEQRDAEQRQREQDEIDGDAEELGHRSGGRGIGAERRNSGSAAQISPSEPVPLEHARSP